MSGPRVTSGTESKQDYATPDQLIGIVAKRFGPISFDLAAHFGHSPRGKSYESFRVEMQCATNVRHASSTSAGRRPASSPDARASSVSGSAGSIGCLM